jgi:hypothetical protein
MLSDARAGLHHVASDKNYFLAFGDDPHVLVSCRVHLEHERSGKPDDAQSFRQRARPRVKPLLLARKK